MAAILGDVELVFGTVSGMVGDVAGLITGEPLLLLTCVAVPLCGIGVGMLKRLLSARA